MTQSRSVNTFLHRNWQAPQRCKPYCPLGRCAFRPFICAFPGLVVLFLCWFGNLLCSSQCGRLCIRRPLLRGIRSVRRSARSCRCSGLRWL